jgi:hypothetical protein
MRLAGQNEATLDPLIKVFIFLSFTVSILNPYRVLNEGWIVHPGLPPGAIYIQPLPGFKVLRHSTIYMIVVLPLKTRLKSVR